MSQAKLTWNEANTDILVAKANALGVDEVSQEQVVVIAGEMAEETERAVTARQISSKLRKLGYKVQLAVDAKESPWTPEMEAELVDYLNANEGEKTYREIAAAIAGGKFNYRQVQGKVLALQLTEKVKPTEATKAPRKFTPEEEDQIVALASAGKFLEEIAETLCKTVAQIRGKTLSLVKEGRLDAQPSQRDHKEKVSVDMFDGLDVENMTVAELAEKLGKNERGIRSTLTRRGRDCVDHKGAARRAKLDAKEANK